MAESLWRDDDARRAVDRWGPRWGEELALRTYSARLLGADPGLVRHGGGNTSLKEPGTDAAGLGLEVLRIKASGRDLARLEPGDHVGLDLARLQAALGPWSGEPPQPAADDDRALDVLLRSRMLDPTGPAPSLETPVHAVLPGRFVDHAHPDDLLALSHRPDGRELLLEAAGDGVVVLPYASPGLALAAACRDAVRDRPELHGLIWELHGAVTWGDAARESYERLVALVARCAAIRERTARRGPRRMPDPGPSGSRSARVEILAGLRGLLAPKEPEDATALPRGGVVRHRSSPAVRALLAGPGAARQLCGPPLTADHVVRTGPWPVWLDPDRRTDWPAVVAEWSSRYRTLVGAPADAAAQRPRTALVPGLGLVAAAPTAREADVALDLLLPALEVQAEIAAAGEGYVPLDDAHLAEMDLRPAQQAKRTPTFGSLHGRIALITGAAGAIGSGVAEVLAAAGAHVALADLPGEKLERLATELETAAPGRVLPLGFDVADPEATEDAVDRLVDTWGGLDLFVPNAGLAHVAPLEELRPEDFRRLQAVNVEGTLHGLRATARLFRRQGLGGDVVLVSTKNVFAPGASFGAYSATKAGAHQLARVAALELAPLGVRVNMVAPDAVFGSGERRSGLWAEVGPSRMKARGLGPEELESYYRDRNLLRARVEARHVGEAVLFFATRRTPTTGATLPVDGGLPDATPR